MRWIIWDKRLTEREREKKKLIVRKSEKETYVTKTGRHTKGAKIERETIMIDTIDKKSTER